MSANSTITTNISDYVILDGYTCDKTYNQFIKQIGAYIHDGYYPHGNIIAAGN